MTRFAVIWLSLFCLFIAAPPVQSQSWEELLEIAESLRDSLNYDSAIVITRLALDKVEAKLGPEDTAAARALNQLGDNLVSKALYEEAEIIYERSLAIREKVLGSEHADVATTLNNLARLYKLQGRYIEAEPLFERALAVRESVFEEEHPDVAQSLNNLATLYCEHARFDEAEPLFERALATIQRIYGTDHADVAVALSNLAFLYQAQGRYAEAEPLYRQAVAMGERASGAEHLKLAPPLNNLAGLCSRLGKYDEAEELYERVLTINENALGPMHPRVAVDLNNRAALYDAQGKYAEALPLYERALAINEMALGPDHQSVAVTLQNLAVLCSRLGKHVEAERYYKRALLIHEKALGPEHPRVALTLNSLASLYSKLGEFAEAEQLHKRALAISEKALGPEHPLVATILSNLGDFQKRQDRFAEAEALYRRALDVHQRAYGHEHPDVAISLERLAKLYRNQARYNEAEPLFQQALDIREKIYGCEHPYVAETLESMSLLYRIQNNELDAERMAARAFHIRHTDFAKNGGVLVERDALEYSSEMTRSAHLFLSCSAGGAMPRAVDARRDVDIVLLSKGQVSDGMFERQRVLMKETDSVTVATAESLRLAKFQLSQLFVKGPGKDIDEYRGKLDSLTKLADELEADLLRHSTSFRKHQSYKDVNSERISSMLSGNSVLVEYLKYNYYQLQPDSTIPRYLAIVVTPKAEPEIIDLGDASNIEPLVDQYRRHMLEISIPGRSPTAGDTEDYKKISQGLYARIWKQVEQRMVGCKQVLISPDGALSLLSFPSLVDGEERYLIEKYAIHHLSAGRDIIRLNDRTESGSGLFAIGDPDYDATALARLSIPEKAPVDYLAEPNYYSVRNVRSGCGELKDMTVTPLPFTRSEVDSVAAGWKTSSDEPVAVYFGSDASEEKMKAEAPGNRVIHLATHGYYLESACQPDIPGQGPDSDTVFAGENPLLLSGLFFAGANLHGEGADSVGAEDGILTAYEVSAMDLEGTEIVVLSACETGLGQVKEGEGIYGLRRAFQIAGVRTVVCALWSVSDRATAEMIGQLYQREDLSIPDRMRELQLDKIADLRSHNKSDHPYTWGAFIALGDWR